MFVRNICAIFLNLFAIKGILCQESDCLIPDGLEGFCVTITECPSINNILVNSPRPLPSSVADILKTYHCGFENNNMPKVCCKDFFSTDKATPSTMSTFSTSTTELITTKTPMEPSLFNRDREEPEDVSNHRNLKLLPLDCGDTLDQKVSNGNKTELFEFPWMAQLQYDNGGNLEFLCGGSLISSRYVLTAAHCVTKLKSTIKLVGIRIGEYDTSTDEDCQIIGTEKICADPVQDIPIEEAFAHPLYDRPRFSNDVGVIRLSREANTTPDSVRPVCLPVTFLVQNTVLKKVSIAGWGTTESQRPSSVLLKALLPIVPNDICQTKFYKSSIKLSSNQMCAGGDIGVDSCKGDSGGPLIYPTNLNGVRMVQFGIISAGVSVCSNTNNFPGIYVRVAYYMRWILDQMKP